MEKTTDELSKDEFEEVIADHLISNFDTTQLFGAIGFNELKRQLNKRYGMFKRSGDSDRIIAAAMWQMFAPGEDRTKYRYRIELRDGSRLEIALGHPYKTVGERYFFGGIVIFTGFVDRIISDP